MKLPKLRVFHISFDIPQPDNWNGVDYSDFTMPYMTRWIQAFVDIYQARPTQALISSNKSRVTITVFSPFEIIEDQLRWVFEQPDAFNVRSAFVWI